MAEFFAGLNVWIWRMRRKVRKTNATSEETAKKPEDLGIPVDSLEKLVKWRRIKRTEDGRYYVPCEDGK